MTATPWLSMTPVMRILRRSEMGEAILDGWLMAVEQMFLFRKRCCSNQWRIIGFFCQLALLSDDDKGKKSRK